MRKRVIRATEMLAVAVGVVATVGALGIVRARRRRLIPKGIRKAMVELLEQQTEGTSAASGVASRALHLGIEHLDDRKLVTLFALVRVGRFVHESGIDPVHPSVDEVASAARKYVQAQILAPTTRDALLAGIGAVAPETVKETLSAGLSILAKR